MKRKITAFMPICLSPLVMLALFLWPVEATAMTETFNINYNESDFTFTEDEEGNLHISTVKYPASYKSDEPAIPYISADFAVKGGSKYESSSFTISKRLIRTNITLAQSPLPVPTNIEYKSPVSREVIYLPGTYPDTNCQYVTFSDWGNIGTVHFLTCPFVYQ